MNRGKRCFYDLRGRNLTCDKNLSNWCFPIEVREKCKEVGFDVEMTESKNWEKRENTSSSLLSIHWPRKAIFVLPKIYGGNFKVMKIMMIRRMKIKMIIVAWRDWVNADEKNKSALFYWTDLLVGVKSFSLNKVLMGRSIYHSQTTRSVAVISRTNGLTDALPAQVPT